MERIETLAKKLRQYPREEARTVALHFAEDFMRLRRDLRNYERLTAAMERIQLVRSERTREISRMNNSLYEFLLPSEAPPAHDQRGQSRRGEGGRSRVHADHPGSAGARAESGHALQPQFLRAGEAHSGPLWRRQSLYRRRRHGAGHFRDGVQPLAPARRFQSLRPGQADSGHLRRLQRAARVRRLAAPGAGRGHRVSRFRADVLGG